MCKQKASIKKTPSISKRVTLLSELYRSGACWQKSRSNLLINSNRTDPRVAFIKGQLLYEILDEPSHFAGGDQPIPLTPPKFHYYQLSHSWRIHREGGKITFIRFSVLPSLYILISSYTNLDYIIDSRQDLGPLGQYGYAYHVKIYY